MALITWNVEMWYIGITQTEHRKSKNGGSGGEALKMFI